MKSALWGPGFSKSELDSAQERFGIRFPPDLFAFLLSKRIVDGYNWGGDDQAIRNALNWPFEGLLFDVENNGLWWPEWGECPSTADERAEVLRAVVDLAPRLIPVYSHRYIPETPHKSGNPVFSVYQADVIHYGRDLGDYLSAEFTNATKRPERTGPIRYIPFWSDLVVRNEMG